MSGVRGPATQAADDHPAIFRIYAMSKPITTTAAVIARWTYLSPRPIAFMGSNHIGPVAQAHPLTRSERDTFVVFISQTGKERVRIGTALKYLVSGPLEK